MDDLRPSTLDTPTLHYVNPGDRWVRAARAERIWDFIIGFAYAIGAATMCGIIAGAMNASSGKDAMWVLPVLFLVVPLIVSALVRRWRFVAFGMFFPLALLACAYATIVIFGV